MQSLLWCIIPLNPILIHGNDAQDPPHVHDNPFAPNLEIPNRVQVLLKLCENRRKRRAFGHMRRLLLIRARPRAMGMTQPLLLPPLPLAKQSSAFESIMASTSLGLRA